MNRPPEMPVHEHCVHVCLFTSPVVNSKHYVFMGCCAVGGSGWAWVLTGRRELSARDSRHKSRAALEFSRAQVAARTKPGVARTWARLRRRSR